MLRKLYGLGQKVLEYKNRRVAPGAVSIYMFHRIGAHREDRFQNIRITEKEFQTFIETKQASGFVFISPRELEQSFGINAGMITFDDMFQDAYQYAVPFLERCQIPYVCFLSPGLIGKAGYITRQEACSLKESPLCTVGAHGMKHRMVRSLTFSEKCREVSRQDHEAFLGQEIDCFAYPYGSLYACDKKAIAIVEQEYQYGFSTLEFSAGESWCSKKPGFLPRININSENYRKYL